MTNNLTKNKRNNKTMKNNKVSDKLKGGASRKSSKSSKALFIFPSAHVSTQSNTDMNYREVGVVHITQVGAINFLRDIGTGVANFFGKGGFDGSIYDKTRNKAMETIVSKINTNSQKICNLRMDVENNPQSSSFLIHLYGTLLQKKQ
jgi:uncharacterized protein YbjQ (UPF0145 family)